MKKSEIEILETKGVETVLLEIAQGFHGSPGSQARDQIDAWILSKTISKRDAREETTLSVARRANTIAIIAMALSTAIAISMIIIQLLTRKS